MKRYANYCTTRRAGGFNLMEVLVAMGLFALGFAAIASIFPAAAVLQRNTATDVKARSLKANAKAVISATPLSAGALDTVYGSTTATDVRSFTNSATLNPFWSRDTRSYPAATGNFVERDLFWVPLLRDADPDISVRSWQLFVFVLRRDRNTGEYTAQDYPNDDPTSPTEERIPGIASETVSSVSDNVITLSSGIDIWPGDPLLDSLGVSYRVTAVNAAGTEITVNGKPDVTINKVWYAPPADRGNSSPAVDLFVVTLTPTLP